MVTKKKVATRVDVVPTKLHQTPATRGSRIAGIGRRGRGKNVKGAQGMKNWLETSRAPQQSLVASASPTMVTDPGTPLQAAAMVPVINTNLTPPASVTCS